jgi:hypothetical protein
MRLAYLLLWLLLPCTGGYAQDTLRNETIIRMVNARMSRELIEARIKTNPTRFDLTPYSYPDLLEAGVSESIIVSMWIASMPLSALTNADIMGMYHSKMPRSLISKRMLLGKADFDFSPEALKVLERAKIPNSLIKEMRAASNIVLDTPLPPAPAVATAPVVEPAPVTKPAPAVAATPVAEPEPAPAPAPRPTPTAPWRATPPRTSAPPPPPPMPRMADEDRPENDTLYNKTIVELTNIKLPQQTIIAKIGTSVTSFDVSVKALKALQASGVHGDVITEMIRVNGLAAERRAKQANSRNPNEMHRPGIYVYRPYDTDVPVKKLDPTIVSASRSGGVGTAIAQAYTYGIAKSKVKSSLAGPNSRLQILSVEPVFYFYFETNDKPDADNWFFATATSPNEFVCVTLRERPDSREMEVGASNAYGSDSGIPNRVKVDFDYEKISEGIYKVTFKKPMKPGEYCFLYANNAPTNYSNNKVFDFGIIKAD